MRAKPFDPTKYCLGCGYILDFLPESRCPECGRLFDPDKPSTFYVNFAVERRNLLRNALIGLGALLLSYVFGAVAFEISSLPWAMACGFACLFFLVAGCFIGIDFLLRGPKLLLRRYEQLGAFSSWVTSAKVIAYLLVAVLLVVALTSFVLFGLLLGVLLMMVFGTWPLT